MITLRPLALSDASETYLSWLNDAVVNRYSRRRGTVETMEGLRQWLAEPMSDLRMAILLDGRHVGGVSISPTAELSIMLGARDTWGKGYGETAIDLMACHGFEAGLERIWAESPNPAFNRAMIRLGWVHDGTRESMFGPMECWSAIAP